ncbi:SDR family NAD(P)-dependent oxidoreductase [Candidatus Woesearchaeota archaeon]|nr:SDR family NAD(P)-dependent oxidoreductase [Candidatus Woesearchaeota archaeon]
MKGKKVLVTGGSGFIGSHLVDRLMSIGAEVTLMTKYNSLVENIRLKDVWDKLNIIEVDLRDIDSLKQVKDVAPEIIYHLAAYNHVGSSFMHVNQVFDVNAKGTANLIEAYDGYERFIYTSTSEIYGYQEEVPFRENMNPCPISPYSVTKYAGELYCRMKMRMGNPIVVLRPFNTFGPYQSSKAVIPEIATKCLNNETVKITKGTQTREFNYVGDIIDGLILAGEKEEAIGKIINLGNGREIAIKELAEAIVKLTGSKSKLEVGALPHRPIEIWRMCAANDLAKKYLGWEPKTSFEEGLKKTIDWFQENDLRI